MRAPSRRRTSAPRVARIGGLAGVAALALLPGCVKRTINVTSEPPGALVWVNDVQVGRTPCATDFTFFGRYDVRLRLEGYEPVVTSMEAQAPLYEYPPADLVAEAIPVNLYTNVNWHFVLQPVEEQVLGPAEAETRLLGRARRARAELGGPLADYERRGRDAAGTPTTTQPSGTSETTTAPAPTTAP